MAGAGGHRSLFPGVVRLRRPQRRLDGSCWQFSNGLGIRSCPRRQHRAHWRIGLDGSREFTLGLAFGNTQHHAVTTLFQALAFLSRSIASGTRSNGSARAQAHCRWRRLLATKGICTRAVSACSALMKTNRIPAPSSPRSRSRGEKQKATRTRADITWFGPATWSTVLPPCSPPAIALRRSAH